MTIEYVCGYGRSASTRWGVLLAERLGAVAVGEAWALARTGWYPKRLCACGHPASACPFWSEVAVRLRALDPRPVSLALTSVIQGWWGALLPMVVLRRLVHRAAFSSEFADVTWADGVRCLEAAAGGAFIDSSKTTRLTANRPRLLAAAGLRVNLYLPTKPVGGQVRSYRQAQQRRGRSRGWLTASVIVLSGRATSSLAARWSAATLRTEIHRLDFAELDATTTEFGQTNHQLFGNRARGRPLD